MSIILKIDKNLAQDEIIWRYMDIGRLVSMLDTSSLWLARADSFKDCHEGKFPTEMRSLIEQAYKGMGNIKDNSLLNNADDFQDYLVKNTFISCWHKNLDENMVMWEIYGKNKNSVAVQTTVGHLVSSIEANKLKGHSLILKEVSYKGAGEITGVLQYEECFFIKRPHFEFEKEVRISLNTYSSYNPRKDTPMGYQLPVTLNNFIVSIVVHPDAEMWLYNSVVAIAKKFNLHTVVETGEYGNE